jgi:L-alanine-DL-glutamate epimerase-like enolase superfamily enzyme
MHPRPRLFESTLRYQDLRLHTASSGPIDGLHELYLTLDYDGLVAASEVRVNIAYLTGVEAGAQRKLIHDAVTRFPFSCDPEADRVALDGFSLDHRSRALLETALIDAIARMRGVSAAALLGGPEGPPCQATNQTLFRDTPDRVVACARAYFDRGYRDLKLRIGFGDPADDLKLLHAVRQALGPAARLSADVNGAWSLAQAESVLEPLAKVGLDYLEQPIAPDHLEESVTLARRAGFPIMLDESLQSPEDLDRVFAVEQPFLLHLKLVKIGGIDRLVRATRQAREAGHDVMIGQMNEGGLATAAVLSAAAALRPRFTELYGADGLIEDPAAGLLYTQGRVCSEEAVGIGASLRGGAVPSSCSEIPL